MKLLLLAFILAGCGTASAYPLSHWERLPESGFQSFVSDGPVDAGQGAGLVPDTSSVPYRPSILPTARPTGHASSTITAKGVATYQPGTGYWASPSALIRAWPGTTVTVCGPLACRVIALRNECACGLRHGARTLLDLSIQAWIVLCGDPSAGVCSVEVTR